MQDISMRDLAPVCGGTTELTGSFLDADWCNDLWNREPAPPPGTLARKWAAPAPAVSPDAPDPDRSGAQGMLLAWNRSEADAPQCGCFYPGPK